MTRDPMQAATRAVVAHGVLIGAPLGLTVTTAAIETQTRFLATRNLAARLVAGDVATKNLRLSNLRVSDGWLTANLVGEQGLGAIAVWTSRATPTAALIDALDPPLTWRQAGEILMRRVETHRIWPLAQTAWLP